MKKPKAAAPARTEELRRVEDLIPYKANAKIHDVPFIRRLIETNGYTSPVLADRAGNLHAGHGRLKAVQSIYADGGLVHLPPGPNGPTIPSGTIPVIDCTGWTETQRRLYIIADNQSTIMGGLDETVLIPELTEIREDGGDLSLTGLDETEISALLDPNDGKTDPDDVPEPPVVPVSRPGDLWLLGKHRILCGDSTKTEDVARLMWKGLADLVFTDPPYGVDYDGGTTKREKLAGDTGTLLYEPCCAMAAEFSSPKAALYLWHAGVKGIAAAAAAAAAAAGYEIRCEIVWNKNQAQFGALSAQYKQKHEPCYYCFKKGSPPHWFGPTNETTVWDQARSSVNEFHPTQKPVELAERAMANSCPDGGTVLDLFGGSGSTLIAAEKTGRSARLVELAAVYCDTIVARWEKFSGKTATLDGDGRTFAEVKAERTAKPVPDVGSVKGKRASGAKPKPEAP